MAELSLRGDGLDWRELDGDIVVLPPGRADPVIVNRAGAVLWRALAAGTDRAGLARLLVEAFGIDHATAQRDVETFLAALADRGFLAGSD